MKAQAYVNARTKNYNPLPIPVPFCCELGSLPPSIMPRVIERQFEKQVLTVQEWLTCHPRKPRFCAG